MPLSFNLGGSIGISYFVSCGNETIPANYLRNIRPVCDNRSHLLYDSFLERISELAVKRSDSVECLVNERWW